MDSLLGRAIFEESFDPFSLLLKVVQTVVSLGSNDSGALLQDVEELEM